MSQKHLRAENEEDEEAYVDMFCHLRRRYNWFLLICLLAMFGLNDLRCFASIQKRPSSEYDMLTVGRFARGPSSHEDRTLAAWSQKKTYGNSLSLNVRKAHPLQFHQSLRSSHSSTCTFFDSGVGAFLWNFTKAFVLYALLHWAGFAPSNEDLAFRDGVCHLMNLFLRTMFKLRQRPIHFWNFFDH